ncbi:MAG TPA: phospholipase D-like domain-containing protein [Terriglobales bacterium]|nr:phospholipase D-like domain-containing protein [Terriglobales bacterium]
MALRALKPRPHAQRHTPARNDALADEFRRHKPLRIIAVICIAAMVGWLAIALFAPGPAYKFTSRPSWPLGSQQFREELSTLTGSRIWSNTQAEVIPNGNNFYPAELDAIRHARRTVDFQAYIFKPGDIGKQFVEALAERAAAGVKVNVVIDGLGSGTTNKLDFKQVTKAGGKVSFYHPLRWYDWIKYGNRSHRELLIVDGSTGFLGGAGVADTWYESKKDEPQWRDDMFRVRGDAVAGLQATFAQNWLEASGELISGAEYFPVAAPAAGSPALVVDSSPSAGGSTHARILFQTLIAAARRSILITTPYFLPDHSANDELLRAIERGVTVQILVPGDKTDHGITRAASRWEYGDLLKAGAEIFEYQPSMIHAKLLVVDGQWAVLGSTNFDSRSFRLNDEVNLAALDPALAQQLTQQFQQDLQRSRRITLEEWKRRGPWERLEALWGRLIQRQQ